MRLLLPLVACASLLAPSAALACKCVSGSPPDLYRQTQVLVEGKLVTITTPEREPGTVRYTFEVTKGWKGGDKGDRVTVMTDKTGPCAVKIDKGQSFIVAATDEGMGFASLKPCHPFYRSSNAKDAASVRKTLDSAKDQGSANGKPVASTSDDEYSEKAEAKAAAKKKKQR